MESLRKEGQIDLEKGCQTELENIHIHVSVAKKSDTKACYGRRRH
jgi:hypothetical protein